MSLIQRIESGIKWHELSEPVKAEVASSGLAVMLGFVACSVGNAEVFSFGHRRSCLWQSRLLYTSYCYLQYLRDFAV